MLQLGAEGVVVGSGIFKPSNPAQRAEAIVKATTFFDDPDVIAKVVRGLNGADMTQVLIERRAPGSNDDRVDVSDADDAASSGSTR